MPSSRDICRAERITAACSSGVPCEKFRRNTLAPHKKSERSTAGSRDAGPTVATIFVRLCRICSIEESALCLGTGRLLRMQQRSYSGEVRARSAGPALSGTTGGKLSCVASAARFACRAALYRARELVGARRERERARRRSDNALANFPSGGSQSAGGHSCRGARAARAGDRAAASRPLNGAPRAAPARQSSRAREVRTYRTAESASDSAKHAAAQPAADAKYRRDAPELRSACGAG